MERKLVKQGRNALTVTLPAAWLKAKGLVAGNSVYLIERNSELAITTALSSPRKTVTVDLTGADRSMFFHVIIAKYIEGHDTIIVNHDAPKVAQDVGAELMGMVIEEHSRTRTVYRSMIAVPEDNFDALVRRAGHLLVQLARSLETLAKGKASMDDIRTEERLLDYHLLFCLRFLNKYENREHAYRYFLLCATLEQAGDHIKQLAKCVGRDVTLARLVGDIIERYVYLLFAGDLHRMYTTLREYRKAVPTRTFAHGLAYSLGETLYNYIGFIVGNDVSPDT
ncbi:TPA: hypothetical protein HA251_01940 [Candidatus Woesearchaeota archaeon]|nr:hypothetical protein [Candidatus Woesearchaeota archaeon]